ncbi:hypothetical protein [Ralstonia mannitolilytica]|uniref:hypothetical protein n=1 Tax=Ralstonia mannitolilytica TaxID=105219 RepID=UPI000CEDB544|nr:hypothetical protein [Ralstonia mannitolilytica]
MTDPAAIALVAVEGGIPRHVRWKEGVKQLPDGDYTLVAIPNVPMPGWDGAIERAKADALFVYKDSCNHTHGAIDYMAAVLRTTRPGSV